MNAMNVVFIPNGSSESVLEAHFDFCYRAFYSRPDILWRLTRLLLREPRFATRLAANAYVYVRTTFEPGRYCVARAPRPAEHPSAQLGCGATDDDRRRASR